MLKLAVQAKGRLNEKTIRLLTDSGIRLPQTSRSLILKASGFPLEVLYLRDDDIPQAVAMGVADIGIVGENEVAESDLRIETIMKLGFGKCRLSLAAPKGCECNSLDWFNNKRVATSYPHILEKFFIHKGINAYIHKIAGSVEVAPAVGMADAIFDIVSSGGTLVQNGLIEICSVMESEAVLVANPQLSDDKCNLIEKLKLRLNSIIQSEGYKYVLMNLPPEAVEKAVNLIPGMKSPTLIPLANSDWYALQVVLHENDLWDKIEQLKQIGAEDILVLQLENIIR